MTRRGWPAVRADHGGFEASRRTPHGKEAARRNFRSGGPLSSTHSPGAVPRPSEFHPDRTPPVGSGPVMPHLPKKALWIVTVDWLPALSVTTALSEIALSFAGARTVILSASTGVGSHVVPS